MLINQVYFKMSNLLSVVIISKNEENFISEAIDSASFADEVLVVDSGSSDNTCNLALDRHAKVIYQKWLGYGPQKNFAIESAKNNWVFVLDADERITNDLQKEVKEVLLNPDAKAYYVARLNYFFGKAIKSCGLYPDYSIRLFDRRYAKFNDAPVHESVETKHKKFHLKNHMLHFSFHSIKEFETKQKQYAKLSVKKKNMFKAFTSPIWVFFKIFFLRLGFLDGWRGFMIALIYSKYTFWKYFK